MANRKQTPDVLGEVLGGAPAAPEPALPPTSPPPKRKSAGARRRRPAKPAQARWEYLEVAFYDYGGYRPRYVNGEEQGGWKRAPLMYDYLNQLGQEGWELAAIGSRHNNLMPAYFKRPQRRSG